MMRSQNFIIEDHGNLKRKKNKQVGITLNKKKLGADVDAQ